MDDRGRFCVRRDGAKALHVWEGKQKEEREMEDTEDPQLFTFHRDSDQGRVIYVINFRDRSEQRTYKTGVKTVKFVPQAEDSSIFACAVTAINRLEKQIGDQLSDAAVNEALRTLQAHYGEMLTREEEEDAISFSSRLLRLAYLYVYTPAHALFVYKMLSHALEKGVGPQSSQLQDVLCLGGGPGSEVLGILKFIYWSDPVASETKRVFTVLDSEKAWSRTWKTVFRSSPLPLTVTYEEHNVLKPLDNDEFEDMAIPGYDLITVIFLFSALFCGNWRASEQFFCGVFSRMKSGAYLLFIDNNRPEFYDPFYEWATKCGLVARRTFRGESMIVDEEDFPVEFRKLHERFKWDSKHRGKICSVLFMKP